MDDRPAPDAGPSVPATAVAACTWTSLVPGGPLEELARRAERGRRPPWEVALAALVGVATVAAVLAGNGHPVIAVAPVAVAALAWAFLRLPLRVSAAALLVLMLAVDENEGTWGQWRSPLSVLGDLVHYRIDGVLHVRGLAFTGMELACAAMLALWLYRKATRSTVDGHGAEAASVLTDFLVLCVAGVLFSEAWGVARGLPVAPYKLRNLLHPVLLAVVFVAAFRGPRDLPLIGRIVVFSACVRAVLAWVIQRIAIAQTGGKWETATSHGDSILFAVAALVLVVDVLERPGTRTLARAALLLPVILLGAVENERRLVWVMLAMMGLFTYLVAPMRGWKRSLTRLAVLSLPLVLLYVAVGWNSGRRIFAPIQTLRSVSDTSMDRSAYWREVEAWNILVTLRGRPLLGAGLGGEYVEYIPNDDISGAYKEYREWPHNTVLGLLMLMGLFAFTAHWVLMPLAVFLSVRSYRAARHAEHRVAALACVGAVTACAMMAYGDTGAHYPQHKIFAALALAVAAQLAVATGAWPRRARCAAGAAAAQAGP
jgi:hypothetical protein